VSFRQPVFPLIATISDRQGSSYTRLSRYSVPTRDVPIGVMPPEGGLLCGRNAGQNRRVPIFPVERRPISHDQRVALEIPAIPGRIMGRHYMNGRLTKALRWLTTFVMAAAAVGFFATGRVSL
jgi:hypothetical protein